MQKYVMLKKCMLITHNKHITTKNQLLRIKSVKMIKMIVKIDIQIQCKDNYNLMAKEVGIKRVL